MQSATHCGHSGQQHQSVRAVQRRDQAVHDVVGFFPNDAAIRRFVGALLLEQNDEWQLQRRYMSVEALQTLRDNQPDRLSTVFSWARVQLHQNSRLVPHVRGHD